jgi:hypothetical protein
MNPVILVLKTVAVASFRDWIREKLLYNLFFVSLFLLFFGYLAALLVYGHQDRVMLHFGMAVNAFSIFGVAASAGVKSFRSDLDQRTAYLTLSRPISRVLFYWGKWIGICVFLKLNWVLLNLVLWIGLHLTGGRPTLAFLQASSLSLVESFIISAFAMVLSLMLRPALAVMGTLAYFFVSHNHEQLTFLSGKGMSGTGLFSFLGSLTPDAQILLLGTRAYYELPLAWGEWFLRVGYGLGWALVFMFLGNAVFYRKNI